MDRSDTGSPLSYRVSSQLQLEIFTVEEQDYRAVLRLSGEVDPATAHRLVTAFHELAARRLTEVIVDASRVTFMDSGGVHALTHGEAIMQGVGSRIVVVTSPRVRRLLDLVSPAPLFAARFDSMQKAREAFGWPSDERIPAAVSLVKRTGGDGIPPWVGSVHNAHTVGDRTSSPSIAEY